MICISPLKYINNCNMGSKIHLLKKMLKNILVNNTYMIRLFDLTLTTLHCKLTFSILRQKYFVLFLKIHVACH